ncbi:MAG: mechanosensitive ion channel family protein [Burkholderiaceae bacterium]
MNEILQLVSAELGRIPAWAATTFWIFAIIVVAWIATAILRRVIAIVRQRIASRMPDDESVRRIETLGRVMRYIVTVVVSMLALMLVLSEIGISVASILGAAGVVGVAVGFGAQSLVKDYFTGFFLLIENQIRNGDVVTVAAHSGMVDEITLRHVRLRDYSGHVHLHPERQDRYRGQHEPLAFAVMDVGVAYQENVDAVFDLMRSCARDARRCAMDAQGARRPRDRRRRSVRRLGRGDPVPDPNPAARAMGRATRIPSTPEGRLRSRGRRDPVPAPHALRGAPSQGRHAGAAGRERTRMNRAPSARWSVRTRRTAVAATVRSAPIG